MQIKEIEILTDDMEKTFSFYSDILGLDKISSGNDMISFKAGSSKLVFRKSENRKPEYHFAFNVPCNQFEQALKWISSKTELIKVTEDSVVADFKNWNAKSVYFYDNNGNILEFIARFDLDNASQIDFSASSIQCISEIGVVADDAVNYSENLIKEYKLEHFSRGGETDVFVPLGDDNGLLIVVGPEKHWYPTSREVKRSALRVTFKVNNKENEITVNERY